MKPIPFHMTVKKQCETQMNVKPIPFHVTVKNNVKPIPFHVTVKRQCETNPFSHDGKKAM